MNLSSRDIFDLEIYNNKGEFVTELNFLTFSALKSEPSPHLSIQAQLLSSDFLKFIGIEEKQSPKDKLKDLLKR